MEGYKVTPASRRSQAGFRRTLPPQESELRVCQAGCTIDHDAGKVAGRDHWKPRKASR